MKRIIKIKIDGNGDFDIWEGSERTNILNWDEMLAQIVELTHPKLGCVNYPMFTSKEWRIKEKAMKQRFKNKNK